MLAGVSGRGPLLLQGRRRQGTRTMQAYLARRLLALVPALFFASLIVFVIVRLVPGSIIDMMLAQNDVGADKLSRDQLGRDTRPRPPDVAAIFSLDQRHSPAWRFRPVALAEHAGAGTAGCAAAGDVRTRLDGDDRGAAHGDPDRNLFGDPAGHRRRLSHPLLLDPDARGAELLDGHHGDGVPLDLVGLVAGSEFRSLHAKIRYRTSSR